VTLPLPVCEKEPFRVAFEHPLISAFASGAVPKASAAAAAIVKVVVMVLSFIDHLLFGRRSFRLPLPFRSYRRQAMPKSGHSFCNISLSHPEKANHRRTVCGNYESLESLGRW
jgi:hypothetical protein